MIPASFVYFGTNKFSVVVLEKLFVFGYRPSLVVTVPDRLVGRKKILTPPLLKRLADNLGLKIIQPADLKNPTVITEIKKISADFAVVAEYGKIIPKTILEIFPKGVLNLHPSLLPRWRGPSPVQSAILNGDIQTGVSIILLDEQMDHGPIVAQEKTEIMPDEYFGELYGRLANFGSELLIKIIPLWLEGKIIPFPQDDSKALFCRKFLWPDGKIDLAKSRQEIYNQVRALSYEPGCWLELPLKTKAKNSQPTNPIKLILKVVRARLSDKLVLAEPRQIRDKKQGLSEIDNELVLILKDGLLVLETVQPQGKRVMSGKEFLNGYRNKIFDL